MERVTFGPASFGLSSRLPPWPTTSRSRPPSPASAGSNLASRALSCKQGPQRRVPAGM